MRTLAPSYFSLASLAANAATLKQATPENYRCYLTMLEPGDTLVLAAGVYKRGLPISDCHGTAEAWITIQGPDKGVAEIRQTAVANCVELKQCRHVALKRLSIHDNVFADCPSHAAITLRDHDLPVKLAHIYNNTICSAARGIRIASATMEDPAVIGKVVFAGEPL